MQYVSNVFLDFHDPTIEDAFQTQTVVDGEPGIIDILDTAGQVSSHLNNIKILLLLKLSGILAMSNYVFLKVYLL